jgi:molybdopterin/thiamine biosynthesis adenylyltransferase
LINFNRQSGANTSTIGRRKTDVAEEVVKGINPEADVRLLSDGIGVGNMGTFLDKVNVVVDSLDFCCFKERFILYEAARRQGLWVLTAPPLSFGFTLLAFRSKRHELRGLFWVRTWHDRAAAGGGADCGHCPSFIPYALSRTW